jgi:hypothetical protein
VKRIAEIFSHFRNPDKETVLTPWRVVNLHLSNMVGGYCFLNEQFDLQEVLEEPRLVDQGQVTEDVFLNPEARILEMNSKSGLYPLYMAYSLYAMKLPGPEDKLPLEQTQALWQETVEQQIFVLCKTRMAESITRRTLVGYQDWTVNTTYIPHLLERMEKDPQRLAKKLQRTDTWGKEGQPMKFDAIVGNPPYQEMDGGNNASASPVYDLFVREAIGMNPHYVSMIIPARWYSGGKGLDQFRTDMLNDTHLSKIVDFTSSTDLFPTVDIAGGLCYFLWDNSHDGKCAFTNYRNGVESTATKHLNEHGTLIRYPMADSIVHKVLAHNEEKLSSMVSSRKPFGLATNVAPFEEGDLTLRYNKGTGKYLRSMVNIGVELIDKWKVMISYLSAEHAGQPDKNGMFRVLSTTEILPPESICTETYLIAGAFDTEVEAINYYNYLRTRFVRFLLSLIAVSQHITRASFDFVPVQDFTGEWTDEKLYKKYELTEDEIAFIESTIRVME